jgi:predicted ATPase with chaperone activity
MTVLGMRSLGQVVAELCGQPVPDADPVAPMSGRRLLAWRGQERLDEVDMVDVLGMEEARFAVEVAAAGGHHILLAGPKGCGKTTLAERIPTILPDLALAESLRSRRRTMTPASPASSVAAPAGSGPGRSAGLTAVCCSWTSSRCSGRT